MADVAAALRGAITDPDCRGAVLEVTGPTLTFNQLAADLCLHPASQRHVPRAVLRVLATAGPTTLARQAAAALIMDTHPFAHPSGDKQHPTSPSTAESPCS